MQISQKLKKNGENVNGGLTTNNEGTSCKQFFENTYYIETFGYKII